ncbi:MAG: hypothetical protein HQL69_09105 [Magnetococcales bacterium]|nr:hypothetical protein [Magnetococcales bacterium]
MHRNIWAFIQILLIIVEDRSLSEPKHHQKNTQTTQQDLTQILQATTKTSILCIGGVRGGYQSVMPFREGLKVLECMDHGWAGMP